MAKRTSLKTKFSQAKIEMTILENYNPIWSNGAMAQRIDLSTTVFSLFSYIYFQASTRSSKMDLVNLNL